MLKPFIEDFMGFLHCIGNKIWTFVNCEYRKELSLFCKLSGTAYPGIRSLIKWVKLTMSPAKQSHRYLYYYISLFINNLERSLFKTHQICPYT